MIKVQICNWLKLKAMVPYGFGMEQRYLPVVCSVVVLVPTQVAEQVHQVEFVVVKEQRHW